MPAHHHHTHDGPCRDDEPDWAALGPTLEREAEITAPLYRQAAGWLAERQPSPGLVVDVGSGPGVVSCLLAEVFPAADVLAVDAEPALLRRAGDRAARLGLGDRVGVLRAELPGGLDGVGPAGLVWAGRSLHHVGDQRAALAAFAARLAPGGTLAVVEGGLPTRVLPRDIGIGRPGLQSRLDALEDIWFTRMRAELPGSRTETEDWQALMAAVGLRPAGSRTFLLDLPAPLDGTVREHAVSQFARRREAFADELAADDLATLDRLLDPADPEGLHRRPDVFLLDAHTVHTATAG